LQDVFNYLAGQILADTSAENQRILLQLSLLPRVTARLGEQVTGNAATPKLLEELYRRRLFTDRRRESEPVYQFHALFRTFLKHRAAELIPADEVHRITSAAAAQFEADG